MSTTQGVSPARSPLSRRAKFIASITLGRLGRASDVANAAVFFADSASEFVTGVCMEVDGRRCV